jgi:protoporphyrin/coproporphyrin ferrochelatase
LSRAILFLNLGGPEKLGDVKDFLYRLFQDPEIIRIKFSPLRKLVAWLIATTREKKSQALYAQIGGGSPIRKWTDLQSAGVEKLLRIAGKDVFVQTAFTCSAPLVEDVVRDLAKANVKTFMSFPLYPQYSFTTTRGAHARTRAAVQTFAPGSTLIEMPSFPTHPLFIQAHAELIQRELAENPSTERTHIVFSAHSIPEKLVTEEGDPYRDEMIQSVTGVIEKIQWKGEWTLSWQSKLGPVKWLSPSTEEVIIKLGEEGLKRVVVVPIAFVTDHIETLEELDMDLKELAHEKGIKNFIRVPGLNDSPSFLQCLADLALKRTDFWA